jgi:hypothetical protein
VQLAENAISEQNATQFSTPSTHFEKKKGREKTREEKIASFFSLPAEH